MLLVIMAFAWLIFAPHSGIWALLQQHSRRKVLEEKTAALEADNKALEKEIEQLRKDPAYLEDVARREHGLLKKNEYIYDFSQQKKE